MANPTTKNTLQDNVITMNNAKTLESSLQRNIKDNVTHNARNHKTGLKNRTECNAHYNNQTKMKST